MGYSIWNFIYLIAILIMNLQEKVYSFLRCTVKNLQIIWRLKGMLVAFEPKSSYAENSIGERKT